MPCVIFVAWHLLDTDENHGKTQTLLLEVVSTVCSINLATFVQVALTSQLVSSFLQLDPQTTLISPWLAQVFVRLPHSLQFSQDSSILAANLLSDMHGISFLHITFTQKIWKRSTEFTLIQETAPHVTSRYYKFMGVIKIMYATSVTVYIMYIRLFVYIYFYFYIYLIGDSEGNTILHTHKINFLICFLLENEQKTSKDM